LVNKILWENEKKTNQEAASMRTRTLKTCVRSRNNGKQDQTEKSMKVTRIKDKTSFYEIDGLSYNSLTY